MTGPDPRPSSANPPRLLAPVAWLLAGVWLGLQTTGRAVGGGLDAYLRGAEAIGRGVTRGSVRMGRAVLRALGPAGRLLRRLLTPLARLLRRWWDRLGLWLLQRLFRPLGRFGRWTWAHVRPLVAALRDRTLRVLARLDPVLRSLATVTAAVDAAAGRLGALLRRIVAPVVRAASRLRHQAGRYLPRQHRGGRGARGAR